MSDEKTSQDEQQAAAEKTSESAEETIERQEEQAAQVESEEQATPEEELEASPEGTAEEKTEESEEDLEPAPQEKSPEEPESVSQAGGLSEEDLELLQSGTKEAEKEPESELVGPAAADEKEEVAPQVEEKAEAEQHTHIFALRTTANREDQVLSFVSSNAARKKLPVHAVIAPHGMRGYIFVEADDLISAEHAAAGVPYAKGVIPKEIDYKEIEHMLEQVKKEVDIRKNDIVEIIAGPFKRESAKITRVDKSKEEVVVELLEAAVPIPITLKMDDVKVIRREGEE